MKWLSDKGASNQSRHQLMRQSGAIAGMASRATSQVAKLTVCLLGTGVFLSGDVNKLELTTLASVSPQQLNRKINQIATDISVRILAQDSLGSGFIVKRDGQEYIVITNQHVLRAGDAPFQIETFDGQVHTGQVVSDITFAAYQYDLAILKFHTEVDYATAQIGSSRYLEVGEPVFAAGFPYGDVPTRATPKIFEQSNVKFSPGFALKSGRVAMVLNQPLEEGYQIGYTNDVKKGMSGGPLLNSQGEVVGVNGKHAYPLWESPEVYQDGSEPCPAMQDLITRSSLAIPIEKTLELNPQLASLKLTNNSAELNKSNWSEEKPSLVVKMQAEAQATANRCREHRQKTPSYLEPEL